MRNSESEHYTARSGESDARPRGWLMRAPSPRLRGEGRGEGARPRVQAWGKSPSPACGPKLSPQALAELEPFGGRRPGAQERADLSPQAGRGGASRAAVHQYERDML